MGGVAGVNGLGNKTFQVMWAGAKYAVTENLDVISAYYHYIQNSFFGTPAGGPGPCSGSEHPQCAGTFDGISAAVDWRFAPKWDLYSGIMFTQVNGGLASGFPRSHSRTAVPLLKARPRPICGLCFGWRRRNPPSAIGASMNPHPVDKGDDQFFRTTDAFRTRRYERRHRFTQKGPRSFVWALRSIAVAEPLRKSQSNQRRPALAALERSAARQPNSRMLPNEWVEESNSLR
ncbi:hypothetical protein ACVWWO_007474 [Bradyrhizobium sp. F1.13.1]